MLGPGLIIALVILLAIVCRVVAGSLDQQRIEQYLCQQGGKIVGINWSPFGKGWFGEKNDRIYEVVYYDREGQQHMATCKTGIFSGVYFTDDRVARRKAGWEDDMPQFMDRGKAWLKAVDEKKLDDPEVARLRDENERLRSEVERLRGA